jgi:acetyl-CoA carboxylase carboxyl transferase subunit alpha
MGLTADRLLKLNLIDGIIPEPPGGAHRDLERMAENFRAALARKPAAWTRWDGRSAGATLPAVDGYGVFKEAEPATPTQSSWQ